MPFTRFAELCAAKPEALAIVGSGRTRAQLLAAARVVASELRRLPPPSPVSEASEARVCVLREASAHLLPPLVLVALPRSETYAAVLLGVLAAGWAWVAVDAGWPQARLAAVLATTRAHCTVTDGVGASALQAAGGRVLRADTLPLWPTRPTACPAERPAEGHPAPSSDVCYVCCTSGSSGAPKGVLCSRAGLLARCDWAAASFPAQPDDVAALRSAPVFVDAVAELFAPLLAGIPLAVLPAACDHDPLALVAALVTSGVTRLTIVPSLLLATLPALRRAGGLRLRVLLCSGEPLLASIYQALSAALPGARVLNVYGCTEAGADNTVFDPAAEGWSSSQTPPYTQLPIGRPLPGYWVTLTGINDRAPVLEAGMVGELVVGGSGVAHGYLGDPELTEQRFFLAQLPDGGVGRAHRTGDLAAWAPDGTLRLHGRADSQIKVRGQRVDLTEVEAVLASHPDVRAAAARAWPREHGGGGHGMLDPRIAGYVELNVGTDAATDAVSLRAYAAERLVHAAVPSVVTIMAALPLGETGKLDRLALQEPASAMRASPAAAAAAAVAASPTLARLCAAFGEALGGGGGGAVAADTDFFRAGGSSLDAALLCGTLGVPVQALLDHPTPQALAAHLPPPAAATVVRQRVDCDADQAPPAKRLRLPAPSPHVAHHAAPADPAWRPARALSFGGRLSELGGVRNSSPVPEPSSFSLLGPSPSSHGAGDGACDGAGDGTPLPAAHLACAWRVHLRACIDASPLLLLPGDASQPWRCVVGSHANALACIQLQALPSPGAPPAHLLWEAPLGGRVEAAAAALLDGLHVVVGCHDGMLSVLRLLDGSVAGLHAMSGAVKSAPGVDPWTGHIWAACHGRTAVALRGPSCALLWRADLDGAVSAPVSFDALRRRVYFATLQGTLLAVDDGVTSTAPREAWRASARAAVFACPCVVPAPGTVLVSCADGFLRAFDVDGVPAWSASTGGPLFCPPTLLSGVASRAVLGTHDGRLLCLRCCDGGVDWALAVGGRVAAAPALGAAPPRWWPPSKQLLAVATVPGELVLVALEEKRGAPVVVARTRFPGELFSAPVMHAGVVLLGCRDDHLYALALRAGQEPDAT